MHLRIVSKQWCDRLDKLSYVDIEWSLIPKIYYDRIVNLRIRSSEFSGLKTPFKWRFKYPLLVKEITFGCHVTSENVRMILSSCTCVEVLRFYSTATADTCFESENDVSKILGGLKHLKCLHFGNFSFGVNSVRSSTFQAIFGNPTLYLPKLALIHVNYAMYHTEWKLLFNFVARHSFSLRSLCIAFQCVNDRQQSEISNPIYAVKDFMSKKDINCLKLTSVTLKGWSGQPCNCGLGDLLWTILENQTGLERLEVSYVPNINLLKTVIKNNKKSLRSVKAYSVNISHSDEVDGSLFRECSDLSELCIAFSSTTVIVVSTDIKVNMFCLDNLSQLPTSLITLKVAGCDFLTVDLIEMSKVLKRLKVLEFNEKERKSSENCGITPSCFISVCKNLEELVRFSFKGNYLSVAMDEDNGKSKWRRIHEIANEMDLFCGTPCYRFDTCDALYSFKFCSNSMKWDFINKISTN